ncbi:MAG: glutamine synthetase family protein [Trebonia sp.]
MSTGEDAGVGQPGFVARHGLLSASAVALAGEVAERILTHRLRTVRLAVVDQHGVVRARALSPDAAIAAFGNGLDFSGAIYSLDTGNNVFVPAFAAGGGFGIAEFTGFPDVVLVPDPATFQILPWADRTGWLLCDAYFASGQPVPLDGRGLLRRQLAALGGLGYDFTVGLEIEFSIFRPAGGSLAPEDAGFTPPPPAVSIFERGYQFMSETRLDSMAGTLDALRDALWGLGLPPRSMEDEWGPGQVEVTFAPMSGLAAADAAVLFRSAVKQVCQRRGLLATFMSRPGLANITSSGWHLHQSLTSPAPLAPLGGCGNAFASDQAPLSGVGLSYVAGLIEHAVPSLPFAVPTVNGYKRFRPYSFAPDRVAWAIENRGALVRVQGSPGDAGAHVEYRAGEPAANPYLYLAASLAAGMDGVTRGLTPPPPVEADPYAAEGLVRLPTSLAAAVKSLDGDSFYRGAFGEKLVDYLVMMKRAEIARYEAALAEAGKTDSPDEVTDWEMREYFEFF